jgi:3-oxoacyl-[acyl-carrier-protein] synthase II
MSNPSSTGMMKTMKLALENASLSPDDIDYINAHATATEAGDIAEAEATRTIFGDKVPVNATKSYTGHTLGACGAHELIYSLLMMKNNVIYPTINVKNIDERCTGFNLVREKTTKELNTVISNNFAFGGINTSIILRKYEK